MRHRDETPQSYAEAREAFEKKWFEDHRPSRGISKGHLEQALAVGDEVFDHPAQPLKYRGIVNGRFMEGTQAEFDAAEKQQDRPASSPLADDGHGHIDASFPDRRNPAWQGIRGLLEPSVGEENRESWIVDLSRFGTQVPVATVLETLLIFGLKSETRVWR